MGSGGDLLGVDDSALDSIYTLGAGIDRRQQLRRIEPPEGPLCNLEHFPDNCRGRVNLLEAFGRAACAP